MKPDRKKTCWMLVVAAAGLSGCVETQTAISPVLKSAPSSDVGRLQAWQDAEHVASGDGGRQTVIGSGQSMLPIYGENTVLVLSKINFSELRPGMQVGYVNRYGRRVVHVLIERESSGWRVQGLNNEGADLERVTPYNLIGVVYASFATNSMMR